jgi:hypothetical protein
MQNSKHNFLIVAYLMAAKPDFLLKLVSKIVQFLYNNVTVVTKMKVQG